MKDQIRRKIREVIDNYNWYAAIEEALDDIDFDEIVSEAIFDNLDLAIELKDIIDDIVYEEITSIDIEEKLDMPW